MATKQKRPTKHLIHEHSASGQHRIVILIDGRPDPSRWFERREVAAYKGICATAQPYAGLPDGLFRATSLPFEVLGRSDV